MYMNWSLGDIALDQKSLDEVTQDEWSSALFSIVTD
jgi:hypothetical protein